MKIGMFTDTYFPQLSGVSTSIKVLTEELRQQGHEVIIFTTTDPKAQPEPDVVRVASIPFLSFSDRRIAYRGFDRCLKIARSMDIDIIHTHTEFSMGLAGKYVASRLNIPNVHTYHTMYENYTHYILDGLLVQASHVRLLSRQYCNLSDGVIAPSQLTKDTLLSYGINVPIRIIATGVVIPPYDPQAADNLRGQLGITKDEKVLLSLSRLSKEKNIIQVLETYRKLQESHDHLRLVVAGDGPERETLENYNRKYQLGIDFVGFVDHDQVGTYYQMADLYLNASDSESQGLTYLEAIVNRCPIIAKRNDYLETIITQPEFGVLFDDQYSMVEASQDFLDQIDQGKVHEINPECLYDLSSGKFAESVMDYYQSLIQKHRHHDRGIFDAVFGKVKNVIREIVIGGKANAK